eukprot:554889-Hanusia_phi.AAC.13
MEFIAANNRRMGIRYDNLLMTRKGMFSEVRQALSSRSDTDIDHLPFRVVYHLASTKPEDLRRVCFKLPSRAAFRFFTLVTSMFAARCSPDLLDSSILIKFLGQKVSQEVLFRDASAQVPPPPTGLLTAGRTARHPRLPCYPCRSMAFSQHFSSLASGPGVFASSATLFHPCCVLSLPVQSYPHPGVADSSCWLSVAPPFAA